MSVSIDADAWLIAQPRPRKAHITHPAIVQLEIEVMTSPQSGLSPSWVMSASLISPK